ncbi:MAG: T9SS type A sorting domain-containing protein [Bacteroidales bacterium]
MKRFISFYIILLISVKLIAQPFSLDTNFVINYNFNYSGGSVAGLIYEPDGKLMIYGSFWDGIHNLSDVLRIYEDGSLDNTWQYIGTGATSFLGNIKRFGAEYILYDLSNGSLGKCNYYGQNSDTSWNNKIWRGNICHSFYQPYIFSDGSMLVGTDSICNIVSDKKRWFMRFHPDGSVDTNFKHSPNREVFGIIKYSFDKLLIYGGGQYGFTRYDNTLINRMCRIDTLGNLDTTFKSIFISGNPRPLYIQNDGKIIVGGYFNIINYPTTLFIVRLNTDGSLDSTFNNFNSAFNNYGGILASCPTSDGGYLIGGGFKSYQGYLRNNIVKTDTDGLIDTSYFNGTGIDSTNFAGNTPYVYNIVKGINDNYYVMGYFTHFNGEKVNPIIRIKGLSVGINEVEKEKGEIKVFPNPANVYVEFRWELPLLNGNATLIISDVNGKFVDRTNLTTQRGQWVWDTRSISRGIYFYEVKSDKENLCRGKVVISK